MRKLKNKNKVLRRANVAWAAVTIGGAILLGSAIELGYNLDEASKASEILAENVESIQSTEEYSEYVEYLMRYYYDHYRSGYINKEEFDKYVQEIKAGEFLFEKGYTTKLDKADQLVVKMCYDRVEKHNDEVKDSIALGAMGAGMLGVGVYFHPSGREIAQAVEERKRRKEEIKKLKEENEHEL